MKQTIKTVAAMATLMLPAMGWAQSSQLLSDNITEIRLEDYAALRVMQGDENRLTVSGNAHQLGTYKGSRLTLKETDDEATLYLRPGRTMSFNTQDFSALKFVGNFSMMDSLNLHAEDYSRITYSGNDGDTLRARRMTMKCEDYSHITTTQPVQYGVGRYTAIDYSRINLSATDMRRELAPEGVGDELFSNSDFGRINSGRHTVDGELKSERVEYDGYEAIDFMDRVTSTMSDMARQSKKKANYHPWNTEFDLAFGWHNWGGEIGSGFGGVEGVSAVSTNFHNIQLAINIPVVNVRGFALKAGLGLDWDRYNFTTPEVTFDATADPMTFAAGASTDATSRLKTRSVVVPIKMEFGNPKKWHFSVAALPGLNWSGNNTGLRRKYDNPSSTVKEKDFAVNQYFNPYHLDVRVAVQYKGMGLYVQAATLPLLKDGCQELYPIKFGIIL
ncbi:MAG: hypothetical protein IJ524_05945 [Bacteroidales bacterium]|nr:hypothetical protein [Bacteroidales bacterium]